jgi:hypothetical protein
VKKRAKCLREYLRIDQRLGESGLVKFQVLVNFVDRPLTRPGDTPIMGDSEWKS